MSSWESVVNGSIVVTVGYYDDVHAEALRGYPTAGQIHDIVQGGVTIPIEEFLTYFPFHKARFAPSRYPTGYAAVRAEIADACGMLRKLVKWDNDGSLYLSDGAEMLPGYVTEYIGVAFCDAITTAARVGWRAAHREPLG